MASQHGIMNILSFGAVGDGVTKCTDAIQSAVEATSALGGGTVLVPAGNYFTGAIHLRSGVNLHLDSGATLSFSDDPEDHPSVFTRWGGVECQAAYAPCLYGRELHDVSITGRGTLDGRGTRWWRRHDDLLAGRFEPNAREREFKKKNISIPIEEWPYADWQLQYLRPVLLQFLECRHVLIEGVTLRNSPFWNTHLVYCDDVTVHNVRFLNPDDAPNGDGLDVDSSTNVRVSNCHFDVRDDCICLKSGLDRDGRRVNRPTENVVITNCIMQRGHGGVVLGSEIAGSIRNVCISNCIFDGTERGIRLKANRARGGMVEDVMVSNILMKDVQVGFVINSFYRCGHDENDPVLFGENPQPVTEMTPAFRRINFQGVTMRGVKAACAYIAGLPESPVSNLTLDNVEMETVQNADAVPAEVDALPRRNADDWLWTGEGFHARHVKNMRLQNVRIHPRQAPALKIENADNVTVSGFETHLPAPPEESVVICQSTNLKQCP